MSTPILNAPTPDQHKLDILRQHFPQAMETDAQGRIRINAAALQLAIDPANPAGTQVEEDGYELRWVGKRDSAKQFFKALQDLPELKKKGVQIHYETKINSDHLAQLISGMK